MDWALAIDRNRQALRAIVLALFALARMRVGGSLFTLPRATVALIMLVLRPAESCLRRLIVIAAHGLALSTSPRLRGEVPGIAGRRGDCPKTPAFRLFDPLKHFDPDAIWDAEPVWHSGYNLAPTISTIENPAEPLPATHLAERLNALLRALDTIPHQARRLMRHYARRDALLKARKPTRWSPIRPGLPPGWRERKVHEIDGLLRECHALALDRMESG